MDHLIGQRFSLISKSEIRYVGILHEINPEQSTIALEEVYSFGTEDRRVDNFIPPSPQKFEYIVFRGSDVKDIKIAEDQQESKPPSQPLNDPAIVNSTRPGPPPQQNQGPQGPAQGPPQNRGESPFHPPPQNYPPPGQYGGFYPPPPPGQFGRGYGPPPGAFGPGPGFPPYGPPPPGYYGPPGQHFPPGPNRFPQQPPAPIGPPGLRQPPPQQPGAPPSQNKQTPELPDEKSSSRGGSKTSTPAPNAAPAQPAATGPTSAPQSKPVDIPGAKQETMQAPAAPKQSTSAPKGNRVTPAMPFTVNQKSFVPPVPQPAVSSASTAQPTSKAAPSHTEMEEASRQAKEAVAAAMAKLNPQAAPKPAAAATSTSIDNLTEKVSQLSTTPAYLPSGPSATRGRGTYRGNRGARTSSGGQRQKMEIPQSDFDFESANAKFNKEDLIKEAIASGSPLQEHQETPFSEESTMNGTNGARKDSIPGVTAYNKSSSFFDNISSDSKDREDTQVVNGRAMRGQEFKKNIETFGQGNVDSGYRGRGRGGYRGRGRGNSNYRGGNYRGRAREA